MRAHVVDADRHDAGIGRHLLSILALPFMNTMVIPSLILGFGGDGANALRRLDVLPGVGIAIASALLAAGLLLVVTSIRLLVRQGRGTLAPWDPPQRLVIAGPYRHVRNPMKAGLVAIIAAEALLLDSPALAVWCAIFTVVNVIYIRVSEEPGLRRRFGRPYREYTAGVPAWVPRIGPWSPSQNGDAAARQSVDATPRIPPETVSAMHVSAGAAK